MAVPILDKKIVKKRVKKFKSRVIDLYLFVHKKVQDTVALESGDNLENLGQPVRVRSATPIGRFKVKEVEKRLPLSCKFVYNHADKIMDDINHVRIQLDEALFGVKRHTWLLKGNIFE
ncbi:hypothetical protein OROMI_011391 [Orobanche minor]